MRGLAGVLCASRRWGSRPAGCRMRGSAAHVGTDTPRSASGPNGPSAASAESPTCTRAGIVALRASRSLVARGSAIHARGAAPVGPTRNNLGRQDWTNRSVHSRPPHL
eukprot:scaffold46338_cov64-Phaeocystis_antarctica.AAC.5